ncbi:D-2-hydroxyacid dehydrogenase [Alicyclobacillus herbarius]|uniref:D-2-hydroxyacid dehydrogenase n=1 Tax=Alicyclobacillus herbarius TaxID=122960 RepID=UPI000415E614|nr:D-2-hydroxyacid dehydrogenase [Alicyclobacillus herbarius]
MGEKPNILVYAEKLADIYQELLIAAGVPALAARSPEEAMPLLPEANIVLGWKVPCELWPLATRVRWIHAAGAGVDDLVNCPHLPEGVLITRAVDQFGASISEYVFSYLLYLQKPLRRWRTNQRKRLWQPCPIGDLAGRCMGVAGTGSIGQALIRRAVAFDMRVKGLNRTGHPVPGVERVYALNEWHSFVEDVDVLVLTLPLTKETYHVVDETVLQRLPEGAILVNVGRGALIDTKALIPYLQTRRFTAVLDVFEEEPLPPHHPLWKFENVWITPHQSGPSDPKRIVKQFVENLRRYRAGMPLLGLVDKQRGY